MDESKKNQSAILRTLGGTEISQNGKTGLMNTYKAIAIIPGTRACSVARRFANHRFLLADAPKAPLAGCDLEATCTCTYRKYADRRQGIRRGIDDGTPNLWWLGEDRRKDRERRVATQVRR